MIKHHPHRSAKGFAAQNPSSATSPAGGGGRSVIVTGGARRVGAALALHFARQGYDVALHYHRSETEAQALKKGIEEAGGKCELFQADLADAGTIAPLMEAVKKALPQTNALVNNASVFERASLMETDEALFDRQMAVNLKAPFFLTRAFAGTFGKGSVVNLLDTDIAQVQTSHFAYLISKKALADFTPMAARELGPDIRVNGVCPGHMLPSSENDAAYEEKMRQLVPMKSHPSLEELAEAVRWLSEQEHITGQIIHVDGGKHVL